MRLPGRHHTRDYHSQVWNGKRWLAGESAINTILSTRGTSALNIPSEVLTYYLPELDKQASAKPPKRERRLAARQATFPVEHVLARLDNVRESSGQWSARCPAHNDRNNSLSVGEADDGTVLIYCHAGCSFENILEELAISPVSLFPRRRVRMRTSRHVPQGRTVRRKSQ